MAGWIVKANPARSDVLQTLAENGRITDWSLGDSYRNDLLDAGQRCFLWVSNGKGVTSGLWAAGIVRGRPFRSRGNPESWSDSTDADRLRWYVPLDLQPLVNVIPRSEFVADPILGCCEVIRSPQMTNPIVLRPEELEVLDRFDLAVDDSAPVEGDDAHIDRADLVLNDTDARYYTEYDESPGTKHRWKILCFDRGSRNSTVLHQASTLAEIVSWLTDIADQVGSRADVEPAGALEPDTQVVAGMQFEDGLGVIVKDGPSNFTVWLVPSDDPPEAEGIDSWPTLGSALRELLVEEPTLETKGPPSKREPIEINIDEGDDADWIKQAGRRKVTTRRAERYHPLEGRMVTAKTLKGEDSPASWVTGKLHIHNHPDFGLQYNVGYQSVDGKTIRPPSGSTE